MSFVRRQLSINIESGKFGKNHFGGGRGSESAMPFHPTYTPWGTKRLTSHTPWGLNRVGDE